MRYVQAEDTKEDDPVELEDVGYAEREAEDYAEYAHPTQYISVLLFEASVTLLRPTIVRIYLREGSLVEGRNTPAFAALTEISRPELIRERHFELRCSVIRRSRTNLNVLPTCISLQCSARTCLACSSSSFNFVGFRDDFGCASNSDC